MTRRGLFGLAFAARPETPSLRNLAAQVDALNHRVRILERRIAEAPPPLPRQEGFGCRIDTYGGQMQCERCYLVEPGDERR